MKCYEVTKDKLIEGIPVTLAESGAFVRIAAADAVLDGKYNPPIAKAMLSPELAEPLLRVEAKPVFSNPQPRLLRCDVDLRSDVWLVPETEKTRGEILLLYVYGERRHTVYDTVNGVEFSPQGAEAEVLASSDFFRCDPGARFFAISGKAVLVRLPSGASVKAKIKTTHVTPSSERGFFNYVFNRPLTENREICREVFSSGGLIAVAEGGA